MSDLTSSSAITEKPRCRVVSYSQKWKKLELGDIIYRHYKSVFNHCPAKQ